MDMATDDHVMNIPRKESVAISAEYTVAALTNPVDKPEDKVRIII